MIDHWARPRFNRLAQPFTLAQLSDYPRSRWRWLHHDERWGATPKQEPRCWTIFSSGSRLGLTSRFFLASPDGVFFTAVRDQRKDTQSMLRRVRALLRRGSYDLRCPWLLRRGASWLRYDPLGESEIGR
jgi:hypothetical protein